MIADQKSEIASDYLDEIKIITRKLVIYDALQRVEQSKIYVDVENIRKALHVKLFATWRQTIPHCATALLGVGFYRRCQADRRLAQKIGRAIGQILVEQHTRIVEADAAGWLRQHVPWPETGAWIGERLPSVIDDRGLIRALADVIEEYEGMAVDAPDRALVHGDLGLHNLALDQADAVNGVFDYDGAAWADRHHDFRYLLFDVGREDMLDAALCIYEPAVERSLDRNRIRLYNAACAIGYLAFTAGVPPEQKSCGRTDMSDRGLGLIAVSLVKLLSVQRRIAGELVGEGKSRPAR
jgi:hypothetical protein